MLNAPGGETPLRAHKSQTSLRIGEVFYTRSRSMHPAQANILAVASRAARGCTLAAAMLDLPYMTAVVALPPHPGHPKCPPLDMQGGPFGQGLHDFMARLAHDTLKRRTRDTHLLCGFFLVLSLKIDQAQCFQFIMQQRDRLELI